MTATLTPTHRGPEILRALGATVLLLLFLLGAPIALIALAPIYVPETVPTLAEVGHALTSPDDGTLLFAVLALIGWVAWAAFAVSVTAEILAGLRRVATPSIPLLGSAQWAASRLVASAAVLLALTSTVTSPTPAAAATVTATRAVNDRPTLDTPTPAPRHAAEPEPTAAEQPNRGAELPTVIVQRGDTLWDIAERHLGDGARFTEIQDLNLGRPQADGTALSDSHWIYPGWALLLPADAAGLDPSRPLEPAAPVQPAPSEVVVEPGDSLWKLAEKHLGNGDRYTEIYAANVGKPQTDGTTLTDPNLIEPGWHLTVPAGPTVASAAGAPAAPTSPTPPKALEPAHPAPGQPMTGDPDAATAVPTASSSTTTEQPAAPKPLGQADDATAHSGSRAPLFIGLSAVAAAGIVGELGRRRHLQHRARRVGESIPMPTQGTQTAAVEDTLRRAATPVTLAQLRTALQNIDTRCYAAERDLPRITAISLSEHTLSLHLESPDPEPVPPFTATGVTWTASTIEVAGDSPLDNNGHAEPYPALVPLGHSDDATVLINLEAAGTLSILGDEQAADDALRALAIEIVTSELTGRIALVADESFADLASAFEAARMHSTPDNTRTRTARADAIASALEDSGLTDSLEARSDRILEDTWLPVVYLERTPSRVPPSEPWTGSVLITREPATGWTLTVSPDGTAALDALGLTLRAQRLSAADLEQVTSLLLTAQPPVVAGIASSERHDLRGTDAPGANEIARTMCETSEPRAETLQLQEGRIRVNVLGPIQVEGLTKPESTPPPRAIELLVYLALRRTASGHELDEVFWPGKRDVAGTRNTFVYRTRQLVGDAALPTIRRGEPLHVTDDVATDWALFQGLTAAALASDDERVENLTAALELVRGRPFIGIDDAHYSWAENDIQVMVGAISDAAHLLARLHHEAGRYGEAIQVATRGLLVEPMSTLLQRDALDAASARGDHEEYSRLRARFESRLAELDPDAEL